VIGVDPVLAGPPRHRVRGCQEARWHGIANWCTFSL